MGEEILKADRPVGRLLWWKGERCRGLIAGENGKKETNYRDIAQDVTIY